MEQIYYTQCPVGYGLGASNGFQVKRLSRGYPASGDFRHLGLRAFPGGGRTLGPPALRYRREGGVAEVAWLTPRAHEYETERGLWGRPGGHFAHGLRLGPGELGSIRHWPAGLFDGPLWRRTDPEPSRGRPPEEVALSVAALTRPPTFAEVAPIAEGEDPEILARLLTALAAVAREGRTLFLIDEPGRLGPRIALLTFAFPEPYRGELTFSTYHDRPEELPGYRIQGTIPAARPNRPALTALGVVADLAAGTFEPRVEPTPWARTLAGWLIRRDPVDEADWSATEERSRAAPGSEAAPPDWSEDGLGHLIGFPEASRDRTSPSDPDRWGEFASYAKWADRAGLADDWIRPRGPAWWLDEAASSRGVPEARVALVAHATLRDAWRGDDPPAGWGRAMGLWFREVEAEERDGSIATVIRAAPPAARPSLARAVLRGLTPAGAEAVLGRLRAEPWCDRAMLLPLEATAAIGAILEGGDPGPLRRTIEEARALRGTTAAVLDVVEAGLTDRPGALPSLAGSLVRAFEAEGPGGGREGLSWALRRGKAASDWLKPWLRPLLADLGRQDEWAGLRDRTPEPLRPALARAVLGVALDPGLPDEAFRWGVETLLLPLAPRPHDPAWAEAYLRRIPSGLDLLRRFSTPDYRKLGVLAWLKQARGLGEVSGEQAARIDSCLEYARALASGDPGALHDVHVPEVPAEERGAMLGQMLSHVGGPALEGLPFVLDACRQSWPGAFEAGSPGLRSLAGPLARSLATLRDDPGAWLDRLGGILGRLGLVGPDNRGFEPDGLGSEIVAAAAAPRIAEPPGEPWPLRQHLLRDDRAWRILAADVGRDLAEVAPDEAPEVLARWDRKLAQDRPERLFELVLNASDGRRLAASVGARAADLKTLPPLPWWDHARHPSGRDDLRDGYARIAPLAPLAEGRLFQVRAWVEGTSRRPGVPEGDGPPGLSAFGSARWRSLVELTNYRNAGRDPSVRWPIVLGWKDKLPLGDLSADDRHRFLAWVIEGLDEAESYQLAQLAAWLKKGGMKDPARVARWAEEIEGLAEIPAQTRLYRSRMVGELKDELYRQLRDGKEARGVR